MNIPAADKKNQENLKKVKSGGKIKFQFVPLKGQKGFALLGDGHSQENLDVMVPKNRPVTGSIEVLREPLVGKGELKVTGVAGDRLAFDEAMGRISKKKVFYV